MRRHNQRLSFDQCDDLLSNQTRGVLSVIGDNGYPYGMSINHYYDLQDHCLYFHGGKIGHKIAAINKDNKVFLCIR